jgi:tripartite-type tricarboxylate transporter receptor subunit TctC
VRTPATIVSRLNGELNKALEDSAVKSRMLTYGATIRPSTPEQEMELILSEIEKWAKVVKATGARVD